MYRRAKMSYRFALLFLCVVLCRLSAAEDNEQTLTETQFNNETLYLRLGYIIGDWLETQLIEFVRKLNDIEMFNEDGVFYPEVQKQLKEAVNLLLTDRHIINSSMIVLYKILAVYSSPTYYSNVAIFRTLATLNIKLNFLANYEKNIFNQSEITVIQSSVEELYGIQSYLAANYPMGTGNPYANKIITSDAISGFLVVVGSMIQESNQPGCEIKQILLANIVTLPPKDIFSRRILQSSVKINEESKVKILDIFQTMTLRLDSELVFMYQEAIMMAIMKLIYNSVVIITKSNFFKSHFKRVFDLIHLINLKIFKDPKLFPNLMVDGFEVLTSVINQNTNYYEEPEYINYNILLDSIELYTENLFENFLLLIFDEIYIVKFLNKILNNINDFKCFHESVKYRRFKHGKHHKEVIDTLNNTTREQFVSNDICQFVLNIFTICYNSVRKAEEDDLITALSNVTEYTFVILKQKKVNLNLNLYNTLMNIAIILVNNPYVTKTYNITKILSVIITKLNIFGTKYCNPKVFKFWFHCIIDSNNENDKKSIEEYIKLIVSNYKPGLIIGYEFIDHLNIKSIHNVYIKNAKVIPTYGNTINFFWKWNQMSISEVYMNQDNLNLNLDDLYAFYNMYFTFYIAIVFYTFKEFFNESKETAVNKLNAFSKDLNEFKIEYFPSELKYLVKVIKQMIQINSYQRFLDGSDENKHFIDDNISKSIIKIENKFFRNGILFQTFDLSKENDLNTFISKILKLINNDLKNKVNAVNRLFSKIQFDNIASH